MVWPLNERKARQASWCWWNFRERAGCRGQGALTFRGGLRTWCWLSRLPWGCEGAPGGHGTASTHQPCFFPVSRLLVKLMWLLLNCISLGQKRNTKPLHVKMKVFGSVFLCLLASTANRELPSFLLKLHIFSSPPPPLLFFTFKAGSLIRTAFKLAAPGMRGIMNGAFLVFLASFPFVLSLLRVLLATLWSRNFANHLLLGPVGHCLNFAAFPWKRVHFTTVCRGKKMNQIVSSSFRLLGHVVSYLSKLGVKLMLCNVLIAVGF